MLLPAGALPVELPVLIDDGEVFAGPEDVLHHIDELRGFRAQWYMYQSDASYCEDDGD